MPGHSTVDLLDASRENLFEDGPRPVQLHVQAPRSTNARGAVVISHGTGGSPRQMSWIFEPLAAAGYVTCTVDHHGHSVDTGYAAAAFARWWDRPLDLRLAVDFVTETYGVTGVGAAGFSIGGYSAAALLGATVDQRRYHSLMSGEIKAPPTPEYPDLDAEILRTTSADERSLWPRLASSDYRDARVAAAFVVCPSLGWMLSDDSLAAIERPIGVRWAEADQIIASEEIEERYVRTIPTATGATVGEHVSHYDFIADNTDGRPVQESVAIDAVAFFDKHLAETVA